MQETILILDFGSQYTQLIARKIRELNVYCEIHPFHKIPPITPTIKGVILSGSPFSVRDAASPDPDMSAFINKLPVLAICYGAQLLAHKNGGEVMPSKIREYGRASLSKVKDNVLLEGIDFPTQVWMSHGDTISKVAPNFEIIASTAEVKVAAYQIVATSTFAIQFHPEVYHSTEGRRLLQNFVVQICNCSQNWTPA